MKYNFTEKERDFLMESHKLLNEIEVKGSKNLSSLVGSILRIEEILKNLTPIKETDLEKEG